MEQNKHETRDIVISIFLTFISVLIGIRIFNEFLRFNDRYSYQFESSYRKIANKDFLVSHPEDFDIKSTGEDTILLIGDSFGQGIKCGNSNNISGCLSNFNPDKKVVNLSLAGTSPGFYFNQLKTYINSQRGNENISGEKVHIILYSNDIVIDQNYCEYYESKQSQIDSLINEKGLLILKEKCLKREDSEKPHTLDINNEIIKDGIIPNQFKRADAFKVPFRKPIMKLIGKYSFLFFREIAAQLYVKISHSTTSVANKAIGRAGYIPKWAKNDSAENIILQEILFDMTNFCKEKNCDLKISTFPNVENLSKESNVREAQLKFIDDIFSKYKILINDGYVPFLDKGILKATYSLTDIHSNCRGYEIYAEWLHDNN